RAPVELSVHVSMRLSSKASTIVDGATRSILLHLSHGWLGHDPRPVLSSMTTVRQALEASSQCRDKARNGSHTSRACTLSPGFFSRGWYAGEMASTGYRAGGQIANEKWLTARPCVIKPCRQPVSF